MTDYPAVLSALYPDAEWSMGETYDSLVWHSEGKKPTQKKLDDAWPQVQHEREVATIKAQRRARYQAETDGLYFDAMRADTPSLAAWRAAVDQIKAELPYPEAP